MKRGKWTSSLACGALVIGVLGGVAYAAGNQGSQSDPLVTLSYLNDVAIPAIMKQVDERIDQREKELRADLKKGGASFAAVEVPAGKTMTLSAGAQVLLRAGTATGADGLVDTTGGVAFNGGALTANHLYMAVGDGQTVTASTACTVMVMGSYSVK